MVKVCLIGEIYGAFRTMVLPYVAKHRYDGEHVVSRIERDKKQAHTGRSIGSDINTRFSFIVYLEYYLVSWS